MASTSEHTSIQKEQPAAPVVKKRVVKKKVVVKSPVNESVAQVPTPVPTPVPTQAPTLVPDQTQEQVPSVASVASSDDASKRRNQNKNAKKPKRLVQDTGKAVETLINQIKQLEDCELNQAKFGRIRKHLMKTATAIKESNDGLHKYIMNKPSKQSGSGFMKKVPITEELKKFGIKYGGWDRNACDMMSRVDATKAICSHIQQGGLFDVQDKRNIKVSSEMKALLKLSDDCKVTTYPLIQKAIQTHFPKDIPVST